jgi:hypothetical protein
VEEQNALYGQVFEFFGPSLRMLFKLGEPQIGEKFRMICAWHITPPVAPWNLAGEAGPGKPVFTPSRYPRESFISSDPLFLPILQTHNFFVIFLI